MKEKIKKSIDFLKQPKVMNPIIIILFLIVLISSTALRLQNLPLLIDQTTGEYLPLALDPFYFLRVSETILENGFTPEIDLMRYPSLNLPFTKELTPLATIIIYKVINVFTPVTLQFANIISPVIFFTLGLIVFFFLVLVITKSKYIALLSSTFLAFAYPYLYRTLAGFSDHESLGMFAFFLLLLIYSLILKYLESGNKNIIKTILCSLIFSILTIFTMLSWSGAFSFIIMIIPASFLLIWLIRFKDTNDFNSMFHYSLFYSLWIILISLFGFMIDVNVIMRLICSYGILNIFTFGIILSDFLIIYLISKNYLDKFKQKSKDILIKYRILFSGIIVLILGIFILILIDRSILSIILNILSQLTQPFGSERVALTVSENVQPYLMDYINKVGKYLFWLSFAGIILIGYEFSRKISSLRGRRTFFIIWIVLITSMLFTRLYSGSSLDGENLFSNLIYFGGILIFIFFVQKIYFEDDIEFDNNLIFILVVVLITMLSIRSAARVFFLIMPFTCLYASYFVLRIGKYINSKEEILRLLLIILLIISVIGSASIIYTDYNKINAHAKSIGPSANYQWQNAMNFVRLNTNEDDIFISWWDYGYWIQYLGERATITDGGHGNAYWDHLIGRYLLTNPNPSTAMKFMKSHNISYLLIDPSDFGKYPAYSRIGGDLNYDRFSILNTGLLDYDQITETKDKVERIYPLGGVVDEDIYYEYKDIKTFLPGPSYDEIGQPTYNTYLVGIIIISTNDSIEQPLGVFMYNGQQFRIPLRYLYLDGNIIDFVGGLDSIAYLFPRVEQMPNGQINIDNLGAMIYLSPKVSKSLFAQLYLLNDVFNNYPTIRVAHSEDEIVVKTLKMQGAHVQDFIYFNGLRGSIKIFEVQYSEDIKVYEEFTSLSGGYGELDYIE